MRPFLTVLTTPIQPLPTRAYRRTRAFVRPWVKPGVPLPPSNPYPGHKALVRSVVHGLAAIGADFNFNPVSLRQLARVVYAPANEALAQAIALKRRGRVGHLVAGPVNALVPEEGGGLLRQPEIDQLIVASDWVKHLYFEQEPALYPKADVCPAGVDADYWRPRSERDGAKGRRAVLYIKNPPDDWVPHVEQAISDFGFTLDVVRYGTYEAESYRESLGKAQFAVFLSTFETQGLALAEAWSMNVPTLVWDPKTAAEWRGHAFQAGSSCPYLTADTGLAFESVEELRRALALVEGNAATFRPRHWVLSHMTDAICAERLYRSIRTATEKKGRAQSRASRNHSGTMTPPDASRGAPASGS